MSYLGRASSAETSSPPTVDSFVGDGSDTTFTLSREVKDGRDAFLEVFVGNIQQRPVEAYSVAGKVLTFTEAPADGIAIYVVFRDYSSVPIGRPPDDSVSDSTLKANAVTHVKLAADAVGTPQLKNDAVTAPKILNNSINNDKLDSGSVQTTNLGDGAVTTSKLGSNLILTGKTIFTAAVQEKANVLTSNILGIADAQGRSIIHIDPLFNSVHYYTGNSQNGSHTVNFVNMGVTTKVGNTTSFVVSLTNNVNSFANISNVQIDGKEARGHENPTSSNCLFVSGGVAAGGGLGGDTEANINIYSFNVTCVSKNPDAYSVFVTKTNFT